jgi:hypothetical protein
MAHMKRIRRLVLSGIGILALGGRAAAEIPQPQAMVLTSRENGTEPQTSFACSGKVFAYLTFPKAQTGKHVMEGIWVGPHGDVVRQSRDEVDFPPPGRRTAVLWLEFGKAGSIWDPTSFGGPDDADRRAYDGRWEIQVRWDDHEFARKPFTVSCY